jgi:hypothetical protein
VPSLVSFNFLKLQFFYKIAAKQVYRNALWLDWYCNSSGTVINKGLHALNKLGAFCGHLSLYLFIGMVYEFSLIL